MRVYVEMNSAGHAGLALVKSRLATEIQSGAVDLITYYRTRSGGNPNE